MFKSKLDVSSRVHDKTAQVYSLSGSLLGNEEGYAFQEEVRGKIASGVKSIVLDLGGVTRIDSSGIGILVAILFSASSAGGRLILSSLPARIKHALGIAMLLDRIEQADTPEEALARLKA